MTSNKWVGITGVSGGLGHAMATEWMNKGYRVIGLDINVDKSQWGGKNITLYELDVTKRSDYLQKLEEIQQSEGLPEIWINNAGIASLGSYTAQSFEQTEKVMAVNFHALEWATSFWLNRMKDVGGKIVNIASVAGHIPAGGMASYIASKHAVVGLTRAIALELAAVGSPLKLILVSPGFVDTKIIEKGDGGFPIDLQFLLDSPEKCAHEIVNRVLKGQKEIVPTLNGKVMMKTQRVSGLPMRVLGQTLFKKALTAKAPKE